MEEFLDDITLDDAGRHGGQLLDVGVEQLLKDPVLLHNSGGTKDGRLERTAGDDCLLLVEVASFHRELGGQL